MHIGQCSIQFPVVSQLRPVCRSSCWWQTGNLYWMSYRARAFVAPLPLFTYMSKHNVASKHRAHTAAPSTPTITFATGVTGMQSFSSLSEECMEEDMRQTECEWLSHVQRAKLLEQRLFILERILSERRQASIPHRPRAARVCSHANSSTDGTCVHDIVPAIASGDRASLETTLARFEKLHSMIGVLLGPDCEDGVNFPSL